MSDRPIGGSALSYRNLRALQLQDLIELYDSKARHTEFGAGFVREEIARRTAEAQTQRIVEMTNQVRKLTWAIAVMTAVTVLATLANLLFL